MKIVTLVSLLTISLSAFCQNLQSKLDKINTIDEANFFIENNKNLNAYLFECNPETDTSTIAIELFGINPHESKTIADTIYKALKIDTFCFIKVSYIYLDGSKLTLKEIEKTRLNILKKYNAGTSFETLVKKFNMDSNRTGELGWERSTYLMQEFSDAVISHKKGDIFTVDIPTEKWYYVTLKTHEHIDAKNYTFLKIKNLD